MMVAGRPTLIPFLPEKWDALRGSSVLSFESPLSDLTGSATGADLDGPIPGLCREGHSPCGSGGAEPHAGIQSAASQSGAGRPGVLIARWYRSQTVLLPQVHVSNYQHIFLYFSDFKRLAGTLPSVYKKHSLTFIFPYLFLIRVFLLASDSAPTSRPTAIHGAVDHSQHHL